MIILNKKGNILADCASIYIAPIPDKYDEQKVFCYQITGVTTTGKQVTIAKYKTDEEAREVLSDIAFQVNELDGVVKVV